MSHRGGLACTGHALHLHAIINTTTRFKLCDVRHQTVVASSHAERDGCSLSGVHAGAGGQGGRDAGRGGGGGGGGGEGSCTRRRRHLDDDVEVHRVVMLLRLYAMLEPFSTRSILQSIVALPSTA